MCGRYALTTSPEVLAALLELDHLHLRELHHRMPVILEPGLFSSWLDPAGHDAAALQSLLRPAADGVLAMHPVGTRVNSPQNDDPSVLDSIGGEEPGGNQFGQDTLFE